MIDAVTFDYWNTLVHESAPGSLRDRRVESWYEILARDGHRVDAAEIREACDASWATYQAAWEANRQYLGPDAAADVLTALGIRASRALRTSLTDAFVGAWEGADLPMADVGVYKPSTEIFAHALAGLGGPPPARTAHVGDRRRTEVAGSAAMGMVAVRPALRASLVRP